MSFLGHSRKGQVLMMLEYDDGNQSGVINNAGQTYIHCYTRQVQESLQHFLFKFCVPVPQQVIYGALMRFLFCNWLDQDLMFYFIR